VNTTPRHEIDPDAVLATALDLATKGRPVFPCVPGEKRPLTRHGLHDATTDPDRIRAWWRRWPTANLAVPTGPASVDVLDVDVHADGTGYPAFNRLKRAGLLAGYTTVVTTPSGGLHLYFPGSDQPSSRLPAHHLDLKAAGGYVLVPPSVVDGRRYELVRDTGRGIGASLDWATVRAVLDPPVPSPAPTRRARHQGDRGGIAALARWVESLPEGRRNAGTYWAACRALEQGVTDLAPLVHAAVRAGLPEREATRTIASATQRLSPKTSATPLRGPGPVRGRS
jgi:hypothetical protein